MTPDGTGVRLYGRFLRLYPRWFRDAYGDDMRALLADQLADERPGRVYARAALDLALTIPNRHLETRVNGSSNNVLPLFFASCVVAALLLFGVGGTNPMLGLVLVIPSVAVGGLAATTWRRNRPFVERRPLVDGWWRWLAGGVTLIALVAGITTLTGELHNGTWYIAMFSLITGLGLIVMGLILGAARLTGTGRGRLAG